MSTAHYNLRKRSQLRPVVHHVVHSKKRRIIEDGSSVGESGPDEDYNENINEAVKEDSPEKEDEPIISGQDDKEDSSEKEVGSVEEENASEEEESSEVSVYRSLKNEEERSSEEEEKEGPDGIFPSLRNFIIPDDPKALQDDPEDELFIPDEDPDAWIEKVASDKRDEYRAQLKCIRDDLGKEEPSIPRVLEAKILDDDKLRALELYDMYVALEPHQRDRLTTKAEFNAIVSRNNGMSDEELANMNKLEGAIKSNIPPTSKFEIRRQILKLNTTQEIKERLYELLGQLDEYAPDSNTYAAIKDKLYWFANLPYDTKSSSLLDKYPNPTDEQINEVCTHIRRVLDAELYGLEHVKDTLIVDAVTRMKNPNSISTLALEGAPGVGKTKLVEVYAKAIGVPFERVALGGLQDVSLLKGSDSHWLGSAPSIFIQILRRAKCNDPLILLDELDKLADAPQVQYCLLHITDYTSNKEFRDLYLSEVPFDLSRVRFMVALNTRTTINPILLNRLHLLKINEYTYAEMFTIAKDYILPLALVNAGMSKSVASKVSLSADGFRYMHSTYEDSIKGKGVRTFETILREVCKCLNTLLSTRLADGTYGTLKLTFATRVELPLEINSALIARLIPAPDIVHYSYIR